MVFSSLVAIDRDGALSKTTMKIHVLKKIDISARRYNCCKNLNPRRSDVGFSREEPKWYTPGEDQDVVLVKHVVLGKVKMEEFSETNPIPRSANRKKAQQSMGALKISNESDDFIFDEIHRRDRLEDEEFEDEMEEEEEDEGELEDQ